LSLLFYECQRSGPLPKTNRIYWRYDSMVDAGSDVGVDLSGGYYDVGGNIKFNFPMADSMTLIAWVVMNSLKGIKKGDQWDHYLDSVKWGIDYFIKCHSKKDEYYAQVSSGQIDQRILVSTRIYDLQISAYKVSPSSPGSEVTKETVAALATA
ncbi:MAG: glycoside hydrolase family 9 protein, partial [Bacilli bacterium]|nr:glycoside hydrolase family 9 protein [Bacilli bacterium]